MTKIINENKIYNMLNTTPRLKNEKAENKQNLIYFFFEIVCSSFELCFNWNCPNEK